MITVTAENLDDLEDQVCTLLRQSECKRDPSYTGCVSTLGGEAPSKSPRMTFVGEIDDKDGNVIFREDYADLYALRCFGAFSAGERQESVRVAFSPSMLSQLSFVTDAAKAGKRLRITVEVEP